jgi:hemoglobin/transferrin/lactoferrin receptor protein
MKQRNIILIFLFASAALQLSAQVSESDTTKNKSISLEEVVISVSKTEETKKTVAQQVQSLSAEEIAATQSQSTADVVAASGNVFVQKSQGGGGSPVIRGLEASRILLVIDGVRMNNLIYRAGHLQDIIKTDNNILDRMEILFGPSSTIYGSDALGGVIHMYTRKPMLSEDDSTLLKVNAMSRYGSVNDEFTGHVDFNISRKKFASLTSFSYSMFGDLKGGENQNPFYTRSYGERPIYAERFGNTDSVVKNDDRYLQVGSGYSQYDVLQKFLFKQNSHVSHGLNIQYSNSSDVSRYDRLTEGTDSTLDYAEWYYGPQMRLLAAYDLGIKNTERKIQSINFGLSYQALEESRHERNFGSDFIRHRVEKVNVLGIDLDFQRTTNHHNMRLGIEAQLNMLESTANRENIVTGTSEKTSTRYPDGDNTMNNFSIYFSHKWNISEQLVLTDGIRSGYSMLRSTLVDTALLKHLPYTELEQNTPVVSGSVGLIHSPSDDLKMSLLFSTGFRVPNVDDLAKVFNSAPGMVIVPNTDLKPEQTLNYELGISKIFGEKTRWENSIWFTDYTNIAVVDSFTFNGQDSILYDGSMAQVFANQNKDKAYIYGFSSNIRSQCSENFLLTFSLNYTYGRIKTDSSDYPLDHIPPFMMRLGMNYTHKKFSSDFIINYNGWKRWKDYNLNGEDNEQYATPDGMPAWFTANFRASYKVNRKFTLQAGVDNMFDIQYRAFASGINAPGRNVFAALRFSY